MQETAVNLSVLIQRVRDDQTRLGYATKEHLIEVCESIVSWPGRYGRSITIEAGQVHRTGWKLASKKVAKRQNKNG